MAAFCGKCGAQLEGDERFCVKCGNNLTAAAPAAAAAPVAPAAPAPVSQSMAPPPQGYAAPPPQGYTAQGQIPVVIPMAPPTQIKGRGWLWGVILVFAILYGLYYIGTHNPQPTGQQQPVPAQPGVPGQPGQTPVQGQPGAPSQPGVQGQPGQYPEQQPGVPRQSANNAALVRTQLFGGRWDAVNGNIQISQARWTNNSSAMMQSATLECVQFAANGAVLTQQQTTLNGPVQPLATSYFGPFQMGSMAPNLAKVTCGIVGVTPASQ